MRRSGPRPVGSALAAFAEESGPATLLARAQAAWPGAAGDVVAREAEPVSEVGSSLEVACSSAVWAQELELLEPDLRARLNRVLGGSGDGPVTGLRFRLRGLRRPRGHHRA